MTEEITVLVTGAGSLLGQGIIRALRSSTLKVHIIAADPSPLSAGLYWADEAHLIPMATKTEYLPRIKELLALTKPHAVLVGTDVELNLFAAHRERIEREFETHVIVSSPEVVAIADDKWKTYEFFRANGFDCPASCLPGGEKELVKEVGFPLVVKPRVGARSVGVHVVRDWTELRAAVDAGENVIVQECVGTPQTEYTAGALYFEGRCDASIVMRRELRDGNTYRAFVEKYSELNSLVTQWTERLQPFGPVNFQFRLADGKAKVFEINARFSGTTALRIHAGFNSVEMTLRHLLLGEPVVQPVIRPIVILRHWSETLVEPGAVLEEDEQEKTATVKDPSPGHLTMLGTSDREAWMAALRRSFQHDVYHLPEYHALAEERGEGAARLFAYTEGEYSIALPLLLRPLQGIAGIEADGWKDATSVYGYPGPVSSHRDMPPAVLRNFHEALDRRLAEERVVAAFSRLHPLFPQRAMLAGNGDCKHEGETVSIDLTQPPEVQRAAYRPSTKSRMNKLRRQGLACERDHEKRHMADFTAIYHQTMQRVHAHSSYRFEPEYFTRLASGLGPALELFVVKLDGAVICGGLFTICNGIVQYHLCGTSSDFLKLAPMSLLVDTARLWAINEGARAMHLGGGVGSKEDSLLEFKRGFSRITHEFVTWRRVLDPAGYSQLCGQAAQWNERHGLRSTSADFFPAYRAPSAPRTPDADDGMA